MFKHVIAAACAAVMPFCVSVAEAQPNSTNTTSAPLTAPGAPSTPATTMESAATATAADTSAAATPAASGQVSDSDKDFITKAAQAGIAEVEAGKLASEKSQNEDIKTFADKMVKEHTAANEELKALASSKGVTLPSTTDERHQKMLDRMKGLSADKLDKAYAGAMVRDHNQAVGLFTKASKTAADAELKAWATKTLSNLKEHQKSSKELASKLGVEIKQGDSKKPGAGKKDGKKKKKQNN